MPSHTFTPQQRALRARVAALTRWSKEDPRSGTEKARAASPGSIGYWSRRVDPDGALPEAERLRRAECAKRAHFLNLAMKSAEVRRGKR